AGGRGKGRFVGTDVGGVKVVKDRTEIEGLATTMLGGRLVTHQTGEEGSICNTVLIEQGLPIEKEFYLAVILDRTVSKLCVMASSEGGMDIEEVAANTPEKILKEWVEPGSPLFGFQGRRLAFALGLSKPYVRQFVGIVQKLVETVRKTDSSLAEINPLVTTTDGKVIALDAKFNFDDNALYRHKNIAEYRDLGEEDPTEVEAKEHHLNYIKLDGSIGCMVNGAGLAMATMDIIKLQGEEPANFLDVGGGATTERVSAGFRIICSDPNVKAILVNIFGGIMKCDIIANGIIGALKQTPLNVPLVVRLEGTNVELGKKLLRESGLPITEAGDLEDAAKKVVAAAAAVATA
ncbi:MAG: ADP-forming succinate--CoA ligase subunit beta, partial [Planctomycetota bacterium]